ncbi:MAG TPA: tRNA 2-selenouridine(34) synthase MnmH [Cyclobacteriaceae bacterium]|nr:tRNA 2-selenouridine(34) synthase MnmH [Cyclobacteriaceae bacterium]
MNLSDFLLLRKDLPVVDVRSEGEYAGGHIRGAINIPILNNEERKVVGIDYKHSGQQSAIKSGFRLIGPRLSQIVEDAERIANGKEILVHCWRGGMRSNYFCQFVGMGRVNAHSLEGGYKAYRQNALDSFRTPLKLMVIGGSTGSGKSEVLRALKAKGEQVIDLESLASHKGSVFGGLMMPRQPTTEQFQNDLFEDIHTLDPERRVWIEDESLAIGKIFLPADFWELMSRSPVVEIEVDRERRIDRLVDEYGPADRNEFLEAMTKVTKRLGGQHFKAAKESLLAGDIRTTIAILLTYYDKAYQFGLETKAGRIVGKIEWEGRDCNDIINAFKHIGT